MLQGNSNKSSAPGQVPLVRYLRNQLNLPELATLSPAGRRRRLAQFRKANRVWYREFKQAVRERAGVSLGMVARVLHDPRCSKRVWGVMLDLNAEICSRKTKLLESSRVEPGGVSSSLSLPGPDSSTTEVSHV